MGGAAGARRSASRVVAVVAAGRVPGIRAQWEADIDLAAITALPPPRRSVRVWLWGGAALAVAAGAALRWRCTASSSAT